MSSRPQVLAAEDDVALMGVIEAIEEAWDEAHLAACDKAWDALHRVLTDGRLEDGNGEYPFSHCVLGPRHLHEGDGYIVSLVEPGEGRDLLSASIRGRRLQRRPS